MEIESQAAAQTRCYRPYYSKDNDNKPNKLVIIEFKKPAADIFENNKALVQCRLYAGELCRPYRDCQRKFCFFYCRNQ